MLQLRQRTLTKTDMAYHLKTRIAITVSLLTLGFMALVGWLALAYFEEEFKASSFAHFADNLEITADGISGRLDLSQRTLGAIREALPVDALADQERMQRFLDSQDTGLLTFDNGILLFAPDGRLRAVNPRQDDVIDMDFSTREYIREPLKSRQPYISPPFQSRQRHRHPIIMFTEPVLDDKGEVAAILGGSLDLLGNNFLQGLITSKVGENGYYLMIDQRGMVVVHPQRDNILRSADHFFPRKQINEFINTDHGRIESIAIGGEEMIGYFQHITPLNWTLIALAPLEEDGRPVQQARIYLIVALLMLSVITVPVVRLLSNRLTSPLIDLTEKVRQHAGRQEASNGLETSAYKELGDLADSIQQLISDASANRKDLNDQLTFLQILIDTIPGPIFYKDPGYRYIGCNRAFEEYIGIPREELVGKTTFDIAPAELAKVYHQADVDLWERGGEQVYEASVKYADGSVHDVIFYKKVFKDTKDEPAGMIGTFLDITDRKASELALLASEKRFRLLVENAADAFFLHDEKGRVLDVNQQACLSLGYSREELLTMQVPDISIDVDLTALERLTAQMHHGERITVEDRHRRKDGTIFPVEVRLCHIEQNGGLMIALARDISDRKRDEKALQKALHDARTARQQVENILRSAADGLVVTDRRNRITHINQLAEEMLGVTAEQVFGQTFTMLFSDHQMREQAKAFLNNTDLDSRQVDFKTNLSGTHFPRIIEARSSMLRTESGEPAGVVTLLRDVSRERELDQIKSEFISTAAHEMRTPLSVIMGYIEILLGSEQFGDFSAETQQEFLTEAYRKGEALTQIVDDLFDISRIEAGLPLPIERSECDLNRIVGELVKHFQKHTEKNHFKISLAGKTGVYADCSKMTQVFENLISNAVKYSPDGGVIEVRSAMQNGQLRIDVEDQGCGMSVEQVDRIFDKFYRADSSNTAVRGLGLGMSIVKAIVEGHGGHIWVTSQPGKGTCVSIEIPSEQAD